MAVADSPTRPTETASPPGSKPILDGERSRVSQVAVYVFVVLPLLALLAAVPTLLWNLIMASTPAYCIAGSRSLIAAWPCRAR